MMMKARILERRTFRLAALAATAIMALTGVAAIAQPVAMPGPWHGHGIGPGPGMGIEQVLASLKDQLNLDTSQQLSWGNAVTETKRVRNLGRDNMQRVHDAMATELAKEEPNLAAVAIVADRAQADNQALRQGVRNQWLQVYAILSREQKAIVRDALKTQMARMETMGARMREHLQKGG
jgi:Spy/CpxP family protein refolding chaperone